MVDGQPTALGPPTDWSAVYRGGRLISTHSRTIVTPVDPVAHALLIQAYDPGFYTAYTIASDPVLTGRAGCTAPVFAPDLTEADKQLQAALAEYGPMSTSRWTFPPSAPPMPKRSA